MSEELQATSPEQEVILSETVQETVDTGVTDAPEVEETDEQKNERVQQEAADRAEKKARGVQKRMDELTADKYAAREEAKRLAEYNAQLLKQLEQAKPQAAAQYEGEPLRESFDNDVDWLRAVAKYDAEQTAKSIVDAQRKAALEERQQLTAQEQKDATHREFKTRMAEVKKDIPDYDATLKTWIPDLPDATQDLIIRMPDGPLLTYHLAKNPELEAQLNAQPDYMHGVLLGQMLATIKAANKPSSAPAPGKPVLAKAGSSNEPPSDPELYRAWADKHLK